MEKLFCHRMTDIHDLVSKRQEARGAQRFSKEVGQVLVQAHKRNDDSTHFYQFSDEVVFAFNMARTVMILRIVARVDGGLVVKRQVDWLGLNLLVPELFNKIVKVHCFLGCLCGCDDLGFAAGESNGGLLLARPRDSASIFI